MVHEFGDNWLLVADVLSGSSPITGTYRSHKACRERFKELHVRVLLFLEPNGTDVKACCEHMKKLHMLDMPANP